jgi:signal transduction histidine kinase
MNRAERDTSAKGSDFGIFQTAVTLEKQVRERTQALEAALHENERINRALLREKEEQQTLIKQLEAAHNQLLQSEKLASIGQLAAGIAHEINNPIGYIFSNFGTLENYLSQLFELLAVYEHAEAAIQPAQAAKELQTKREAMDLDFLKEDIPVLMRESKEGIVRVRKIVQDLKDFSHVDARTDWQFVNLNQGIESTLNVINNEIKYKADLVKDLADIPAVQCLPSQINQVVMNLVVNAAHAIGSERGSITVRTSSDDAWARIQVSDNGCGISAEVLPRIFEPFYTTKSIGKGTGLGLSLSYGIVQKHHGTIEVETKPGKGSTFTVSLPIKQPASPAP